jgi:hypothetical protein
MAPQQISRPRVAGQITAIAWIYIIFGVGLLAACFATADIGQYRLSVFDLWIPGLLILAAVGAILRKPLGALVLLCRVDADACWCPLGHNHRRADDLQFDGSPRPISIAWPYLGV